MLVNFIYRVFYNEDNGYSICLYRNMDTGEKVTCKGNYLPTHKGLNYEFTVAEERSSKYGLTYNVLSYEEVIEMTEKGIIEYFSCGLFAGVSEKTAKKIYQAFGKDSISILDTNIDRLIEVPGIGKKTLKKIKSSYIEKRASRKIAEKLLPFNISLNAISRVYSKFKANAIQIIEEEPYRLCEVRGISFYDADTIAKSQGVNLCGYARVKAASDFVLMRDMQKGNVCMPKLDYALALIDTLNTSKINKSTILQITLKLIQDGVIRYNKRVHGDSMDEFLYHPSTYKAEREIADNIKSLFSLKKKRVPNINALIDKYSDGIVLDESQRRAVEIGVTEPVFIITGGPGTGKTTIIKIIAQICEEINGKVSNVFLSPTGRAARRITESTGYYASTIHSAIKLGVVEDECDITGEYIGSERISNARVIVDEASMIDIWTMNALLKALERSTIGLIGDVDQLPSVKCGSILRDLIKSKVIPCVQLEYVHRQQDDAANICENAKHIKNGVHELHTGDDFVIIDASNMEDAHQKMVAVSLNEISRYGLDNVKVLCPYKKGKAGVYEINNSLQAALNPGQDKGELKIPGGMCIRIGDPVMQLKNSEDVSNGDIGYVEYMSSEVVTVTFEGVRSVTVEYSLQEAKEQLTLAYATTVHKSQGSEYDAIVMCLTPEHGIMKRRNILYTGITRGKHKVILVGSDKAFYDAMDNDMIEDRHSMLAELINPNIKQKTQEELSMVDNLSQVNYTQLSLPCA